MPVRADRSGNAAVGFRCPHLPDDGHVIGRGPAVLERFNAALEVVESALLAGEPVDVVQLSRRAGTSEHHFRRTFSALAGQPIGEYVRRRRMTLASGDVLTG